MRLVQKWGKISSLLQMNSAHYPWVGDLKQIRIDVREVSEPKYAHKFSLETTSLYQDGL